MYHNIDFHRLLFNVYVLRFNGQINTGFKKHVHDVKAGLEEKVPVYIQTYAERREERLKRYVAYENRTNTLFFATQGTY